MKRIENLGHFKVLVILLVLVFFPLFLHLTVPTIFMWDESLRAVNAMEMIQTGDPIVVKFNGEPDLRNTKPPMAVWFFATSMQLFGYDTLGLRLPAALAGLFTVLALLIFSKRYLRTYSVGFWASLILVTAAGFTGQHITRTADIDAILLLFLTCASLFYFLYMQQENKNAWYLPLAALFIIFAALTKGIAGFLTLPGLFLYTIFRGKLKWIFTAKAFYFSVLSAILVIAGYLTLREWMSPGYLSAMVENDLTGRFSEGKGEHVQPFLFYVKAMLYDNLPFHHALFWPWIYLIAPAFIINLFHHKKRFRDLNLFAAIVGLTFLLVISSSETKIYWYSAPVYPLFALIIGLAINRLFSYLKKPIEQTGVSAFLSRNLLPAVITLLIFTYPYYYTIERITDKRTKNWSEASYHRYFKKLKEEKPGIKDFKTVVDLSYEGDVANGQALFLKHAFAEEGYDIEVVLDDHEFHTGETIVSCEGDNLEKVKSQFKTRTLHAYDGCETLALEAKQEQKPSN